METPNEQTIVISDLLSFISCKIQIFPKESLLNCLRDFYSKQEADDALKTFVSSFPLEKQAKLQRKCKGIEPFLLLYNFLKLPSEDYPVFVCKDLNNIPKTDLEESRKFDQEHKDLVSEQQLIKSQILEISSVVYQLKDQIQFLNQCGNKEPEQKNKTKGLAYLQKLIDEEEKEKGHRSSGTIMKEELDDELTPSEFEDDDITEDEQTLDLKANRMQRTFVKNAEKQRVKKDKEGEVSLMTSNGKLEEEEKPLMEQKIIHIMKDELESSYDNSRDYTLNFKESDDENTSEVPLKTEDDMSHSEESPTSMSLDNDFDEERYPNIVVEQVFDEHVGHFSIYKCSLCDFSTNDVSAVQHHDCPQIYFEDPNEEDEDGKAKSYQYFCLHCRFKCKTKLLFQRHTQLHPQSYPCPFCCEKFVESDEWTEHVRACLNAGGRSSANHICQVCGIVYANAGALAVHKGFHDPAKPFECLKCRYRFYTQETLNRHFNSHLIRGFKCPFCIFVNRNKTTLSTHIRCHTGEMPFACHFCDYRSSSQSALTSHSFSHSDKKTVKCDECPSLFKTLHKLKAHKVTHNKSRIHKCPVCGKRFKTGSLMKIHHQRIHLDLRPHACDRCPYKARNSSALKDHMSTHLNEKPYKCFECDFRANHKGYLKRHVNLWHRKTKL